MKDTAPDFDEIVRKEFSYLKQFGFELVVCEMSKEEYTIIYVSQTTGVEIVNEFMEGYIFVMIYNLVNGKLVRNEYPIIDGKLLNGYALDDFIQVRNPAAQIEPSYTYENNSPYHSKQYGLTHYVSEFARNLRIYASDALEGNFEIFPQLHKIVMARVKKHDRH